MHAPGLRVELSEKGAGLSRSGTDKALAADKRSEETRSFVPYRLL